MKRLLRASPKKFDADQSDLLCGVQKFPDFMPVHLRFVPLVERALLAAHLRRSFV
jgi:hypothetical protein